MTAIELLKNTEPTIAHTVSQKALIASVDAKHVDDLKDLADRFGITVTMIVHAQQIIRQMPDAVFEMMDDKKNTVGKVYRQMILQDANYNSK